MYKRLSKFRQHITRRRLIFLVILLLVIGVGYSIISGRNSNKKTVQYTQVKRQTIKSTVAASGVLTGKENAKLRFKSSGKLGYLNVKSGQSVEKGQDLAGLDTQDLALNLQQAQNTYRDKQAAVDKVLDDIHLFQYGNGGSGNVGSANETETQRQLRTTAQAARDTALDSVKLAQRAFQDAVIYSPLRGIVTKADPVPGQVVGPTDIIVEVSDDSEIYFDAEVDEADIAKVSIGQKAEVTLNSYGDKIFYGEVAEILPVTKTTTSGATVVISRIKLYSEGLRFIANLNGQASIIDAEKPSVLTIPQDAVRNDNEVLVKDGDKYKVIKIEKGLSSDSDVEVVNGLQENQEIVSNPADVDPKLVI